MRDRRLSIPNKGDISLAGNAIDNYKDITRTGRVHAWIGRRRDDEFLDVQGTVEEDETRVGVHRVG